ncbi:electron transfer flavoprotein subunit alpha/FixB family protein [Salinarchaeum sp. IM2453]|uniref:electron transfer flavoprotein subunit alpha/FixB family protein n=1 Tax=Salinarchaeum sp. IM2453 TaxID=2862870 RepID=UPI001C83277C|nr:electron transfer flavoprotein subunit alpha/FixB family protein [Salinarchaeum sp. IM2453]QZA88004.1 electron transfer flavoprotein subunit alpha/FixB family protein [Salinarchaeum sp. IM2453]
MSNVLAIAEHRQGELRDESLNLVTAAREMANQTGGELHIAVINGDVGTFAEQLNCEGVDTIHTVDAGDEFNHDIYVEAVNAIDDQCSPQFIMTLNSVNGLDYAPAVAEDLAIPIVTDIVDFEVGKDLVVSREMYGSKVRTDVAVDADRAVLTVRGTEWPAAEGIGNATIEPFEVSIEEDIIKSAVNSFEEAGDADIDISEADFVISVGRGIEEEENIELVEDLVETADATLASSRPIVDNGWLPPSRQVGQSGKSVSADIYIAIGISGAVQHIAGIKNADTVIAINNDPDAPIFDVADYGVVDDLFDVIPQLIEEVEAAS